MTHSFMAKATSPRGFQYSPAGDNHSDTRDGETPMNFASSDFAPVREANSRTSASSLASLTVFFVTTRRIPEIWKCVK
jgi:hypothetical protein